MRQLRFTTYGAMRRAASAVLSFFLLLQTAGTGVAAAASTVVSPATQTVSRASFLRSAIVTLRIPLKKDGSVPYTDVSASFLNYARTAQQYGALTAFRPAGKILNLNKDITRGEALEVLVALAKQTPRTPLAKSYTDVTSTEAKNAAAVAVDRNWMRPLRGALFGWSRPLTTAEEKTLLKKVIQSSGVIILPPGQKTYQIPVKSGSELPKHDVMQTVWDLLQRDYLYKDKIKTDDAGFKSVEGMVNSLNDPYTVYYRPSSTQAFQTQLKGEVTGIGAQVEQKNGVLVIVAPLSGSPAEKAGLKPGDEILSVNGDSISNLPYEDAVSKVRGPKGSVANLHIRRSGAEMDVAVTRDTVRISDIDIVYHGDIPVVMLRQFGQTADSDFRRLMVEVAAKKPRSIVLDLRNNPGGLLDAAGIVASVFLPAGSTYVQIHMPKETTEEKTKDDPVFDPSVRVVVLVNGGSASASEIVAGALQDAQRATIVGEKTFGKGTVQQLVEFTDGSSLKMTIAEWMTPQGHKIDGIGVQPDVLVTADPIRDVQMNRALDLLR